MPERDRETILWSWLPPVALAAILLALWASGTNRTWFSLMNGWSTATGPQAWSAITLFGDALVLLALALPILWYRPRWAWALLAAAIVTTTVIHTLKPWLDVPRPAAVLGPESITIVGRELRSKSMPSGHAAGVFTVAGVLVPALHRRGARVLVLAAAVVVAVSRPVVGAHWPADILAGGLVGWMSGLACLRLVGEHRWMSGWKARSGLAAALAGCAIALLLTDLGYPGAQPLQVIIAVVALGFGVLITRQIRLEMTGA
jgi:undecaprenyl-diphosphatase